MGLLSVLLSLMSPLTSATEVRSSCQELLSGDFPQEMSEWVTQAQIPPSLPSVMDQMEADFRKKLETIIGIPSAERSFENTVLAADEALDAFVAQGLSIKTVSALLPTTKRTARFVQEFNVRYSTALAEFGANSNLYKALKETPTEGSETELARALLRRLEKNGATQDSVTRERVAQVSGEIASLSSQFSQSMQNDTSSVTLTPQELRGVDPEIYKDYLKDGQVALPVSSPDLVTEVLKQSSSEETRKKVYLAYRSRNPENMERLRQITHLNAELARLLDQPSFMHAAIPQRTLIGGPDNARKLLEDLAQGFRVAFKKRIEEIADLKKKDGLQTPVQYWDFYHYESRLTPETSKAIAENALEYFPATSFNEIFFHVLSGMFKISFNEVKDQPVWHKSVKLYQIKSLQGDRTLGYMYIDNYSRKGKNSSTAFVEEMISRRVDHGNERVPVVAFVTNWGDFRKRKSLLLDLDNVLTNLHEMGHALHALLQKGEYHSVSGFSHPTDMMEIPSTTLERLFKEPEMVQALSALGGDPTRKMPMELATQVANSIRGFKFLGGDFHSSSHEMNTVFLSLLDIELQTRVDELNSGDDILKIYREMFEWYFGFAPHEDDRFPQNFHHIAGEYAGFYSSYIIAGVGAANNVARLKELGGIFNPTAINHWVEEALTVPQYERTALGIQKKFWGRAMSVGPVFEELGFRSY